MPDKRVCMDCGEMLLRSRRGRSFRCRECQQQKNADAHREYHRRYSAENREKIREQQKRSAAANRNAAEKREELAKLREKDLRRVVRGFA